MQNKLIKNGQLVDDQWQLLDAEIESLPAGPVIVPLAYWQEHQQALAGREQLGIWLDSDQSPELIADQLNNFDLIAINFPSFMDGRGFSYARELRQTHNFKNEIRAIGSFIRDQLFFLQRCGFDAFALDSSDSSVALASLQDFSNVYQAAIDQPQPMAKRR